MEETKIQKIVTENPDSLEIGTPSKGGAIKVYGNFGDKEIFRVKIDNALELRTHANSKIQ